jgi:hypothetical protein
VSTLSLDQLAAEVASLQAAVQQLQNAATDSLTPNYVTVNADGTVGADFSGTVEAAGIALGLSTSPGAEASEIAWTEDGTFSSTTRAAISGVFVAGPPSEGSLVIQVGEPGDQVDNQVLITAGGSLVKVIDSNGLSSFAQTGNNLSDLASAANARTNLSVPRFWPLTAVELPTLAAGASTTVTFSNPSWELLTHPFQVLADFAPGGGSATPLNWFRSAATATSFTLTVVNLTTGGIADAFLEASLLTTGF